MNPFSFLWPQALLSLLLLPLLVGAYLWRLHRHRKAVLRWSSLCLARLSRRLRDARGRHGPRQVPELEFYAEAGAPEGALYVDGAYVGKLPGITRL